MGYTQVNLNAHKMADEKLIDRPFEGYYIGSRECEGKNGPFMVHDFISQKSSEKISFYGFTALNAKLEQVSLGAAVRITYNGKKLMKTKYGNKEVHQVTVEQDSTRKFEVADPVPSKQTDHDHTSKQNEPALVDEADDDLPF